MYREYANTTPFYMGDIASVDFGNRRGPGTIPHGYCGLTVFGVFGNQPHLEAI